MDYEPLMNLANFDFTQKLNDISQLIKKDYELLFLRFPKSANKGNFQNIGVEDPNKENTSKKGRKPKYVDRLLTL